MPGGDGTGPYGTGPMGWGRGPCGKGMRNPRCWKWSLLKKEDEKELLEKQKQEIEKRLQDLSQE